MCTAHGPFFMRLRYNARLKNSTLLFIARPLKTFQSVLVVLLAKSTEIVKPVELKYLRTCRLKKGRYVFTANIAFAVFPTSHMMLIATYGMECCVNCHYSPPGWCNTTVYCLPGGPSSCSWTADCSKSRCWLSEEGLLLITDRHAPTWQSNVGIGDFIVKTCLMYQQLMIMQFYKFP